MTTRLTDGIQSPDRCLADNRRRHIQTDLRDADDGTARFDDVVDHVVQTETNSPGPDPDDVALFQYQVHLPMLANNGFVDHDPKTETIRYREDTRVEEAQDRGFTAEDGDEVWPCSK
jgi:hypothetical protein